MQEKNHGARRCRLAAGNAWWPIPVVFGTTLVEADNCLERQLGRLLGHCVRLLCDAPTKRFLGESSRSSCVVIDPGTELLLPITKGWSRTRIQFVGLQGSSWGGAAT
jgi:hypothetical protein